MAPQGLGGDENADVLCILLVGSHAEHQTEKPIDRSPADQSHSPSSSPNDSIPRGGLLSKASKTPKKTALPAERKRATSRLFPYAKVAEMWAQKKTIPEIAKAIGRVGKGDDPYHSLRVALTRMHKGYKNAEGKVAKLPHRVSQKTLKLATKAGKKASA